ncbi:hypothetical protein H4R18_002527 [Coemansia javaensis]|uniref:Uncharacterized protein n=1 Tax=Coemansia javaensis TaxID=2761396 RepID=A0A9W8H9G5_9FUNG|nr:hypothetical protein H4R18_002527 [Coemansia javaensis]
MKLSIATACAALAATAVALPSHHYAANPAAVAPAAFVDTDADIAAPAVPAGSTLVGVATAKELRDARRDARRKEWQEWAHQEGANGVPNGTNFVAQILDGGGLPLITPSGSGTASGGFVLGGGIFPTMTFGAALVGGTSEFAAGVSNTIGFGGGQLPTGLAGGGFGLGIASNILMQGSATASEGGWLNGIIPTFAVGAQFNNLFGLQTSSGLAANIDGAGGAGATLGYGGNFINHSTVAINFGAGIDANFNVGSFTPTTTTTPTSAPTTP